MFLRTAWTPTPGIHLELEPAILVGASKWTIPQRHCRLWMRCRKHFYSILANLTRLKTKHVSSTTIIGCRGDLARKP